MVYLANIFNEAEILLKRAKNSSNFFKNFDFNKVYDKKDINKNLLFLNKSIFNIEFELKDYKFASNKIYFANNLINLNKMLKTNIGMIRNINENLISMDQILLQEISKNTEIFNIKKYQISFNYERIKYFCYITLINIKNIINNIEEYNKDNKLKLEKLYFENEGRIIKGG